MPTVHSLAENSFANNNIRIRCRLSPPLWGEENRHFGSLRPASLRRHMRSAAPCSPQFCTCAPTAGRRCPLGSVLADEQPHRSRSAAVSRSERPTDEGAATAVARGGDRPNRLLDQPSKREQAFNDQHRWPRDRRRTIARRISRSSRRSRDISRAAKDGC